MHYLFVTSLLAALGLPLSAIASCSSNSTKASGWFYSGNLPISDIPWEKYNSVTYAFGIPTNDASQITVDSATLSSFVQAAHSNNVNATISLGGFTASMFFSTAVNPQNSSIFVKAIVDLVSQYNLDGIEIDWEYPGMQPSQGCNVVSPNDSANFLAFLQKLRQDPVGGNMMISATASLKPWAGPDGLPLADVSAYAAVLDELSIMNYDVFGSWSATTGPNAPLNDSCAPSTSDQQGSAANAVAAWTKANFPVNKLRLGVASYGHSFRVASSAAFTPTGNIALYVPFDKKNIPVGNTDPLPTSPPALDQCGNSINPGGTFDFKALIDDGYLTANGTNATGIDYLFDSCSQTPFIYNASSGVMISYDDATSFAAKGKFISDAGLIGYKMWSLTGDSSSSLLADAINDAVGFKSCT